MVRGRRFPLGEPKTTLIGKKNIESDLPAPDANARLTVEPRRTRRRRASGSTARELGDKRQFDYAIEYYVNGLEFWPDAVDEACKALHGCGGAKTARREEAGAEGLHDPFHVGQRR